MPFFILFLSKALAIQWDGEIAIKLADKCHDLARFDNNPYYIFMLDAEYRFMLAYQGLETLRVTLTEPDYDYHKKLRAAPQVINLLEDLKIATGALANLSFYISPQLFPQDWRPQELYRFRKIFPEDCIP